MTLGNKKFALILTLLTGGLFVLGAPILFLIVKYEIFRLCLWEYSMPGNNLAKTERHQERKWYHKYLYYKYSDKVMELWSYPITSSRFWDKITVYPWETKENITMQERIIKNNFEKYNFVVTSDPFNGDLYALLHSGSIVGKK